jgi:acetolactate synthase-1/2/3 large subunit
LKKLDGYKSKFPLSYKKQGGLRMQQIIQEMYEYTKGDAIVATDVGQHQMWAAQFFRTNEPYCWLSSGGAGTMGFGFPAAIGAQFGNPDKTVIAFCGDGGFQMTMFELAWFGNGRSCSLRTANQESISKAILTSARWRQRMESQALTSSVLRM